MAINVNDDTYSKTPVLKTKRFQMHDIKAIKLQQCMLAGVNNTSLQRRY
jgi:hypothetical protein